jgi:hypothetical protein
MEGRELAADALTEWRGERSPYGVAGEGVIVRCLHDVYVHDVVEPRTQQAKETAVVGTQLFELTRSSFNAVWSAGACTARSRYSLS